ncbi:Aquaporin [Plakobranchus ocellatus]|uniref:Aquaporin n=1 Tax=Plakobranchus ocellatus TaxID=259542 RepID=A0AAV4BVB9_9GAST|nr:Aquaporin [Plakobranchus ocellatus]
MEALFIHIATKLEAIRFGKDTASAKILDMAEIKSLQLWRAVAAEFIAQALFVILGCASANAISPLNTGSDVYLIKVIDPKIPFFTSNVSFVRF